MGKSETCFAWIVFTEKGTKGAKEFPCIFLCAW